MSGAAGWGSWSFVPLLWVGLLAAAVWYATMLRRVRRVTGTPVGPGHWMFYGSGLAVLLVALGSPLNTIAVHWLLSAHMIQHTLLSDIAPPLLILGLRAPVLPLGLPAPVLGASPVAACWVAYGAWRRSRGWRCRCGRPHFCSGRCRRCSTTPRNISCCTISST